MDAPGNDTVRAFGGDPADLVPLPGGEGRCWRAGPIVLKPGGDPPYIEWTAGLCDAIQPHDRFRVATPRRSASGDWSIDGWWATGWLDGAHQRDRWNEAMSVSDDFHAAIAAADLPTPDLLSKGTTQWAVGDRVAWSEESPRDEWPASVNDVLDRLAIQLDKQWTGSAPQPIHADIGGNILFADGLPPAVIDLSMFLRPAPYANAVLVADAVAWSGAPLALAVGFVARNDDGDQLLARAIAFRLATAAVAWGRFPERVEAELDAYRPLLTVIRD